MSLARQVAAIGAFACWAVLALPHASASADPVADFYRGKTLQMIIATSPGGDYDTRGRLLARHLGRHIPGEPNIVAQNMPGGVGLAAANYMAAIAPRDGTVLHMLMQNMPAHQAVGGQGVKFDTRKLIFIGNTTDTPNVINAWHTTGIKTIEDVKTRELVVGAAGTATASAYYPAALNAMAGTKFKIVTGYPGGNDVNLAMEKGEVGGRGSNSWASWKSTRPQWIADKKINVLVQIGLKRHPDLPEVPLLFELASNDRDREVLRFISADTAISRAVVTTPDTPPERVAALRKAFMGMIADPQFVAEAAKMQIDISPSSGEEAQKIADLILDSPPEVIARAKLLLDGGGK
ncbi:MAG: Tripartite-type tricarboxylate transporter, receptor component TctC [Hyphomicrobiales bacterium]|nr:Tripartite-type tricarboxylate transporter, receptor component TctC [Hyphomicrobiales bacterium]